MSARSIIASKRGPVTLGTMTATGPMLVRVPSEPGADATFAVDTVRQDERLALEVDLEGAKDPGPAGTNVTFEIAAPADGPALVQAHRPG